MATNHTAPTNQWRCSLRSDGLFERRNNQAHNNHIGEIIFQALKAVHRENVGVLLLAALQAWIKV